MMIMAAIIRMAGIPLERVDFMGGGYTINFDTAQGPFAHPGNGEPRSWKVRTSLRWLDAWMDCPRTLASKRSILQQQREP